MENKPPPARPAVVEFRDMNNERIYGTTADKMVIPHQGDCIELFKVFFLVEIVIREHTRKKITIFCKRLGRISIEQVLQHYKDTGLLS